MKRRQQFTGNVLPSAEPKIAPEFRSVTNEPDALPRVFAFTSSSGEVFDYVFGSQDRYRSHWASGWSGRGFLKLENRIFLLSCLAAAGGRSQDIIFLQFGNTDVQFNASHRMLTGDFLEPQVFCDEVVEGIATLVTVLKAAGYNNVHCVSAVPPAPVRASYYARVFSLPAVPARFQGQLLSYINDKMKADPRIPLIDTVPEMTNAKGLLHPIMRRPFADHHADYTKIQKLIWEKIKNIPGIPSRRETWIEELYVHRPRMIKYLMEKNIMDPTDIVIRESLGPDPRLAKARATKAAKAAKAAKVAEQG